MKGYQGTSRYNMGSEVSSARHDENSDQITQNHSNSDQDYDKSTAEEQVDAMDPLYNSWLKKHPSALKMFDKMMAAAKRKRMVVFLDYDGTLSPIVEDPNMAVMSKSMRSAVREVAKCFPTAIISGRSRDKVFEFVQLTGVYYAGSHGMDIITPVKPLQYHQRRLIVNEQGNEGGKLFQPASEFLPALQEIIAVLEEKTKNITGAMIEDNRFCISVHFRRVCEQDFGTLEEIVKGVVTDYPRFHLTRGRKVLEIRPSIKWDKGYALNYLLDTLGFANATDVIPLYIGDDRTDEDAFKVLKLKEHGYPILVSSIPKDTAASFSLRDPSEVMCFLQRLARWKKNSSSGRLAY